MKQRLPNNGVAVDPVASRAEAWIETLSVLTAQCALYVASRAEAWIETVFHGFLKMPLVSRLPRGGVD